MANAHTEAMTQGRAMEEQYEWLLGLTDSSLEKEFLMALYSGGFNLPDNAQFHHPTSLCHLSLVSAIPLAVIIDSSYVL